MMIRFLLGIFLCWFLPSLGSEQPGRKWTTIQRLELEHLQAVQDARQRFARQRRELPKVGIYEDFRAVLHVHAEDSAHTGGTRAEVLEAARKSGVQVVMLSDHKGPKPGSWHGMRKGVLFFAGSEEEGWLRFPSLESPDRPSSDEELRFLSHLEERLDAPLSGFQGLEIYNRHTDEKDEEEFHQYLRKSLENPEESKKFAQKIRRFPDQVFAAGADYWPQILARFDQETQRRRVTGVSANDAHQNQRYGEVLLDPYEVSFRNVSTHILARELSDSEIRRSLREGRVYVAHDWLCDPTGFTFLASNRLGVFEIGDSVPLVGTTRLLGQTPLPARLKLVHKGRVIQETTGSRLTFVVQEPGPYRLEAWLSVDGEERPWIYSNPIYVEPASDEPIRAPSGELHPNVALYRDIAYTEGRPEDASKHQLDVYAPQKPKQAPVFFFIHGGSWRSGDRAQYRALGNRFAREGTITVVTSYRLAPQNPYPAQIEDVAAAFAWVVRHIGDHGGDPSRIYLGGHSAGGHLAALLTLDERYLKTRGLSPRNVRGTILLSGVYEIRGQESVFGSDEQVWKQASPLSYVRGPAPPFLITYCQWDYLTLPQQARRLQEALRKAGVAAELVFIPQQNHISEIVNVFQDDDPTARAILRFIR